MNPAFLRNGDFRGLGLSNGDLPGSHALTGEQEQDEFPPGSTEGPSKGEEATFFPEIRPE